MQQVLGWQTKWMDWTMEFDWAELQTLQALPWSLHTM
jgi:hypothetical protein